MTHDLFNEIFVTVGTTKFDELIKKILTDECVQVR